MVSGYFPVTHPQELAQIFRPDMVAEDQLPLGIDDIEVTTSDVAD
jgi:hypothetical protein